MLDKSALYSYASLVASERKLRMTFASTLLPCLLCFYRSLSLNLLLQKGENIQRTENSIYLISLRLDKHTHVSSSCPCK